MKSGQAHFRWLKPALGHGWAKKARKAGGAGKPDEALVPRSGGFSLSNLGGAQGMLIYSPPVGLFRKFAMLNDQKAQIRAFADDYGDLFAQPHEGTQAMGEPAPTRKHATRRTWCMAIQHMRRAAELWDQINDPRRHEELQEVLFRRKDSIMYRAIHHRLEGKADNISYKVIALGKDIAAYPPGDIVAPALRALQLEIRDALTDTQTPSHSTPGMTRDFRLVLEPTNLLAYMWLTFALVVSGDIKERRCEICRDYIYMGSGPGLRRRGEEPTCGATCRQQKHRQNVLCSADAEGCQTGTR